MRFAALMLVAIILVSGCVATAPSSTAPDTLGQSIGNAQTTDSGLNGTATANITSNLDEVIGTI